ncbi:hypothetical protein [Candidatus Amarobacter glycogenicus]|uniref:hypothetical protein n=1 Tax=Candidatus Amarobacter glycogenicus TaxID=3140699 RepID=UPI002A1535D5|nr:hypothetical protein [Dehalococcoidia bacterium]
MLLNIVLSLLLLGPLQHGGLALANSIATDRDGRTSLAVTPALGRAAAGMLAPALWRTA